VASPVAELPLPSRRSARFGVYPFQLDAASGEPAAFAEVIQQSIHRGR